MNDFNVGEHRSTYHPLDARSCRDCRQPLVLPARRAISLWRLGNVRDGRLGPLMAQLRHAFRCDVVL